MNMLLYQIQLCNIHGKIQKIPTKAIYLKHLLQRGMKNLNYVMDHTLHRIFKIIFSVLSKDMKK